MEILVVTREFPPHVVGGLSYHLGHLYGELSARGYEVTVLSGVARDARPAAEGLVHDDVTVHPIRYGRFRNQHLKFPIALWRFLRDFEIGDYDVACTHTPLPYGLPIPTVSKYHDCSQVERRYFRADLGTLGRLADTLVNPTRRFVERRSLRMADHAIFNSSLCSEAWDREYGVSTDTTTIHNGVDTSMFAPRTDRPSEDYVLFVGDSTRKGLPAVLDYGGGGSYQVYVVGDVEEREGIKPIGHVSQDRLAGLYAGAIATVHPAKFEAFGNVVLESLACGTPVVTTSQCGASEILPADCGAVDVALETGIEQCRGVSPERCVQVAREHTWAETADATETVLDAVR